jgi:transposase
MEGAVQEVWAAPIVLNLPSCNHVLEFPMPKGISDTPTFKPYVVGQGELIPPTTDELIPENHLVRIVNATLDQLDLAPVLAQYSGGGASRYHPLMLLKILVYGYLQNVHSSRKLAKQTRENIYFRWIAGCQSPDFRTINSFRKDKLAPVIEEIFVQVVKLLHRRGYVQLDTVYIDGTKIESRANRYTFVWRKSIETFDQRLDEKVRSYLADARRIADEEDLIFGDEDLAELGSGPVSSQDVRKMADEINQVLGALDAQSKPPVKKNL